MKTKGLQGSILEFPVRNISRRGPLVHEVQIVNGLAPGKFYPGVRRQAHGGAMRPACRINHSVCARRLDALAPRRAKTPMARRTRAPKLETRTSRDKLPIAEKPVWVKVGHGLSEAGAWKSPGNSSDLTRALLQAADHFLSSDAAVIGKHVDAGEVFYLPCGPGRLLCSPIYCRPDICLTYSRARTWISDAMASPDQTPLAAATDATGSQLWYLTVVADSLGWASRQCSFGRIIALASMPSALAEQGYPLRDLSSSRLPRVVHAEVASDAVAPAAVGATHRELVAGLGVEGEVGKRGVREFDFEGRWRDQWARWSSRTSARTNRKRGRSDCRSP